MEIIEKSREFNKKELYMLSKSSSIISVNKVEDGTEFKPVDYLRYRDVNANGETVDLLSIIDADGNVWCSQSPTFLEAFLDMYEAFSDEGFTIVKKAGTAKSGRTYITCDLVM